MKKNIDFKPMQNHSGQQMLVKDITNEVTDPYRYISGDSTF